MLIDFMDNLSCGSWKREGRDEVKAKLIEYFLSHQYGQNYYSANQITEMFKEMDAVGILFPKNEDGKMLDAYAKWREKHHKYWFKKWYYKNQKKPLKPKT